MQTHNPDAAANRGCAVCGDEIKPDEVAVQPYPPNGRWAHVNAAAPGDDCASRYWDAPEGMESW